MKIKPSSYFEVSSTRTVAIGSSALAGSEVETGARLCNLERRLLCIGEQICLGHLAGNLVEVECAGGPLEELDVNLVGAGRRSPLPAGTNFGLPFLSFSVAEKAPASAPNSVGWVP